MRSTILARIDQYYECQDLARELLATSISFLELLSTFISEIFMHLHKSGFTAKVSLELVSNLVHRIFAKDCYSVRGRVAEHLDATNKKAMAVGVLWPTLATHRVLKEDISHGIENHPSIASEYVRFLVANSGLCKLEKIQKRLDLFGEDLNTAKRVADDAKKTVDATMSKALDALKATKAKNS